MTIYKREATRKGGGIFNAAINLLPFELHLPGHQFCGPGTKLQERLARGEVGINPLDSACREHDIAYEKSSKLSDRHEADKTLAESAKKRIFAGDSSLLERFNSLGVWGAMKVKRHLGLGLKKRRRRKNKKASIGRGFYLKPYGIKKKKEKGWD